MLVRILETYFTSGSNWSKLDDIFKYLPGNSFQFSQNLKGSFTPLDDNTPVLPLSFVFFVGM